MFLAIPHNTTLMQHTTAEHRHYNINHRGTQKGPQGKIKCCQYTKRVLRLTKNLLLKLFKTHFTVLTETGLDFSVMMVLMNAFE